jgi:hypothetical protein
MKMKEGGGTATDAYVTRKVSDFFTSHLAETLHREGEIEMGLAGASEGMKGGTEVAQLGDKEEEEMGRKRKKTCDTDQN